MPRINKRPNKERMQVTYSKYTYIPFTDAFPNLKQNELLLLCFISSLNQKIGCIANVQYICKALRMSSTTLWRCEKKLIKEGLINRTITARGKRCWKSNFVFVHISEKIENMSSHRNGHFPKTNGLKISEEEDLL